jgi:hypothetical protein
VDNIYHASEGSEYSIGEDTDIRILAPPDTEDSADVPRAATGADVNFKPINANENGAVFKTEGERSALFMGDVQNDSHHYAESWLIQQHDDPENDIDLDADVLFIGHHGSDNATSKEFLDRVDPEIAVISSDFAEEYNHPHDEVLKNLYEQDGDVYWTAAHGTTRTDLDETLTTDHTEDLDTTAPADLAVVKHYCRENDVAPEAIDQLDADTLPEDTPDWAADASSLVVDQAAAEQMGDVTPETTTTTEETTRSGRNVGTEIADTINVLDTEDAATEMGRTERTDDTSEGANMGTEIANTIDDLGPEDFPDTVDIEDIMQDHATPCRTRTTRQRTQTTLARKSCNLPSVANYTNLTLIFRDDKYRATVAKSIY